jgi:hypothetical protein
MGIAEFIIGVAQPIYGLTPAQQPICPTSGDSVQFCSMSWARTPLGAKNRLRPNSNFVNRFKLIWVVGSPRTNIFTFGKSEIMFSSRGPASARGAYASSRTWGGMRWTRWCRETSDANADGEVVWSWRPDAGAKFSREAIPAKVTGAKEPDPRGERDISRKTIAQGMRLMRRTCGC